MKYQTLDQDVIFDMIKDVPDLITPAAKKKAEYFKGLKCVSCGQPVFSEVTPKDLERVLPGEVLPYGNARCTACGCLFEPATGIELERGSRAAEPTGLIITPDTLE